MPVTPAALRELARLHETVLADGRVEHEQHFVRRAGHFAAAMRRILSSSCIRLTRVCRRPAVSTSTGSRPLRLGRGDRIEHDRGRIGALSRADHVDAGALAQISELLDGRGAKRVGRADDRPSSLLLEHVGQLAHGGGLARAVDADDQHDRRHVPSAAPGVDRSRTPLGSRP